MSRPEINKEYQRFQKWLKTQKRVTDPKGDAVTELRQEQAKAAHAFFEVPSMKGRTTLACLLRAFEEGNG